MRVGAARVAFEGAPQTASPDYDHHSLRAGAPGLGEPMQPPWIGQRPPQNYNLGSPILTDTENVSHLRHAVAQIEERLTQMEQRYMATDRALNMHGDRMVAIEDRLMGLEEISGEQAELIHREGEDRKMDIDELEDKIKERITRLEVPPRENKREKVPMITRRGFEAVEKFAGEMEGYQDWVFKLKAFLRLEDGFEEFVLMIEGLTKEPGQAEIESHGEDKERAAWFDEQLFTILVSRALPNSKALSIVKNCQTKIGYRGALAYHRISSECKGHRGHLRMEALRDAARDPKQCTHVSEVVQRVADWEEAVRLYVKEYPSEVISAYERAKILKEMLPTELQNDIVRLEKRTYDEIHHYATTQAPIRKDEDMKRKGQSMPINGVSEKDEEAVNKAIKLLQSEVGIEGSSEEIMSLLRKKGAGGGKGAGTFDGDCFYCKQKGHRMNACEKATADKARGVWAPVGKEPVPWVAKGGGKGGGGKGQGGNKGGGKGGGAWRNGLSWFDEAPTGSWEGGASWGGNGNYFQVFGVFEGKPDGSKCTPSCECDDHGFQQAKRTAKKRVDKKAARDDGFAVVNSKNFFEVLYDPSDEEIAQGLEKLDQSLGDLQELTRVFAVAVEAEEDNDSDLLEEAPILFEEAMLDRDVLSVDERGVKSSVYSPTAAEEGRREDQSMIKTVFEPTSEPKLHSGRRRRWAIRQREQRLQEAKRGDSESTSPHFGVESATEEGSGSCPHDLVDSSDSEDEKIDEGEVESDSEWDPLNQLIFGDKKNLTCEMPKEANCIGIGPRWFDHSLSGIFEPEEGAYSKEVMGVSDYAAMHGDWIRISSVMDSGACAPVAPLGMLSGYPIRENEASRAGKTFSAASGHDIKRFGEQHIRAVTDNGLETEVCFQLAEVECPLVSISSVCDKGNRVIFGKSGGVIQNVATGAEVPFQRRGGVYALGLWVKRPRDQGGAASAPVPAVGPFARR